MNSFPGFCFLFKYNLTCTVVTTVDYKIRCCLDNVHHQASSTICHVEVPFNLLFILQRSNAFNNQLLRLEVSLKPGRSFFCISHIRYFPPPHHLLLSATVMHLLSWAPLYHFSWTSPFAPNMVSF